MQDSAAVLPSASLHAAGALLRNENAPRSFHTEDLLAPQQAIAAYFAGVSLAPPELETVSLDDALGRVLARDAVAQEDHPAQARSTMDGYAVHSGGTTMSLRLVGTVFAGVPTDREPALR